MKSSIGVAVFCLAAFAPAAGAYQYVLQFAPNAGYRNLVVAGYRFDGDSTVVGNCSYDTVASGSGRGGRGAVKRYQQTCRWDLHGNLLSITPGAPARPAPLYINDSQTVYAVNSTGSSTGSDTKLTGRGFVNTPGAHYSWLTSSNDSVLHQIAYVFHVTLKSDGDVPVNITAVDASALHGVAFLKSTTCNGQVEVGETCSATVAYDPAKLTGAEGLALDTLRIDVTSDAGAAHDFIQKLTIVLPQKLN